MPLIDSLRSIVGRPIASTADTDMAPISPTGGAHRPCAGGCTTPPKWQWR
jgi:hypothetical protein